MKPIFVECQPSNLRESIWKHYDFYKEWAFIKTNLPPSISQDDCVESHWRKSFFPAHLGSSIGSQTPGKNELIWWWWWKGGCHSYHRNLHFSCARISDPYCKIRSGERGIQTIEIVKTTAWERERERERERLIPIIH